jgi:hypothetical protein
MQANIALRRLRPRSSKGRRWKLLGGLSRMLGSLVRILFDANTPIGLWAAFPASEVIPGFEMDVGELENGSLLKPQRHSSIQPHSHCGSEHLGPAAAFGRRLAPVVPISPAAKPW